MERLRSPKVRPSFLEVFKANALINATRQNALILKCRQLLAMIPGWSWLLFAIGLLLALLGGHAIPLSNTMFNVLGFMLGLKLAVVLHELGHLFFAGLVGGTPQRLSLGRGHQVGSVKLGGIKMILHQRVDSGYACAYFNSLKFIRAKLFVYVSGGFVANILIAVILWHMSGGRDVLVDLDLATAFAASNLVIAAMTIIPHHFDNGGIRMASDTLLLSKIPSYKQADLVQHQFINVFWDACDLLEQKKYLAAIAKFEEYQSLLEDTKGMHFNLSAIYLKLGQYQKSLELLEDLLPVIDQEPFVSYQSLIYNGIAWTCLLMDNIEEADKYSELAFQLAPGLECVRGTRGSVLVEKGDFRKGLQALWNSVDFRFPNSQTLSAAMYSALAYGSLGNYKQSRRYYEFVKHNTHRLDPDELDVYRKVKPRIEALAEPVK